MGFPRAFYVANTMEIFERLAWYGFFTLSSLYMTTPIDQGGMGFNDAQRGALQGIIPFFLYLLPVLTGALADRYGYRKMFIASFIIMAPSYFALGQVSSFGGFFIAFSAVALGAACFKPVVVGTISRATDDSNRGMGFGIFYTIVNIGGFIGPLVAGYLRTISWDAVFIMSTCWILVNLVPVIFLYREPKNDNQQQTSENSKQSDRLKDVLVQAQQVLGNTRFALLLFPSVALLMCAGAQWLTYLEAFVFILVWLGINFLWDRLTRFGTKVKWWQQPIQVSNHSFALYLALVTGFWTIYNQLFYTLPLYIRDFVDTADLVYVLSFFGEGTVSFFAQVNQEALSQKLIEVFNNDRDVNSIYQSLLHLKVRVPISEIDLFLNQNIQGISPETAQQLAATWAQKYRQVNPEFIINLDFAAIVLCQIAVSYCCKFFKSIHVLSVGVLVFAIACALAALTSNLVVGGIFIVIIVLMMALGEMITAPKSQEYVAAIAPPKQAALFMGYYFVSMALGFLFAGLLSGWGYGELAQKRQQPELMWLLFAAIGLVTSIALLWFHHGYLKRSAAATEQSQNSTNSQTLSSEM